MEYPVSRFLFITTHCFPCLGTRTCRLSVYVVQYRRDARANTYFRQTVIQSVRERFVLIVVHSKPPSQFSQSVGELMCRNVDDSLLTLQLNPLFGLHSWCAIPTEN